MNYKAVYRTAPATPGLLTTRDALEEGLPVDASASAGCTGMTHNV